MRVEKARRHIEDVAGGREVMGVKVTYHDLFLKKPGLGHGNEQLAGTLFRLRVSGGDTLHGVSDASQTRRVSGLNDGLPQTVGAVPLSAGDLRRGCE